MVQKDVTPQQPKIIALSLLLYRWLLSMGPAEFCRDYGKPALQDFRECCRVAYQRQGTFGVLRLWPGMLVETVTGLLAEYWTELFGRKRPMLPQAVEKVTLNSTIDKDSLFCSRTIDE